MRYEIKVSGSWVEVTAWIFRSWTGERRRDGKAFVGDVYMLGSNVIAKAAR